MKIFDKDCTYYFPLLKRCKQKISPTDQLVLLAYLEDTIEVFAIDKDKRTAGVAQLQAYYRVLGSNLKWIDVLEWSGYRNPATLYEDSNPGNFRIGNVDS
jgi:hypothetical protein